MTYLSCRYNELKGKKLIHNDYGHGKIIEVKGDTVRIKFDNSKYPYLYFPLDFVRTSDVFTFSGQHRYYSRPLYYRY
ncbi:MAG: hypothetical protein Q4C20_11655 [Erysipelotrichaceae bacterium]|nr:hypothetical protein [Erysipelotrichaceae bacterium]